MLHMATASAPLWTIFCALRRPNSAAISGCSRLYVPAEPQQVVAVLDLDQGQVGDGSKQATRLGGDALGMSQMAGIVVSDFERLWQRWGGQQAKPCQELADVLYFLCKPVATASSGRPLNNNSYSFIPEPQPAALVRIASTSLGKACRFWRASARA